jgi:D-alanyl-D-alanine carboxypeptidase
MSLTIGFARMLPRWAFPTLLGCAMPGALTAEAVAAAPECPGGQVAAAGRCVTVEEAATRIDAIVREAMATHDLKAVLAGFAIDGKPPSVAAWGESMTGVPATSDMHFRNGSVAIAYIGTVFLQVAGQGRARRRRQTVEVVSGISPGRSDHPYDAHQRDLRLRRLCHDKSFSQLLYADPFRHWRPDELVAIGLGRSMICDPGTCWSYAHTNFVILGKVLEKTTGRPLQDLIREGILDPLSLTDTRSEATAVIQEPVLHAFDAERGKYEESTYWDPSWTLASGAIMTSNIADILKSAAAIGTGALVSPESHALRLAPLTAKFKQWSESFYYGFGVFVVNGWIVQNPSFAGYAATMAYLPSNKLAVAVSATVREKASMDGNLSTEVLKEIAAYLAPEVPLK